MSRVYDKDGNRIKTYDKYGNEVCVISTFQAHDEWAAEYERAQALEKIAVIEAVAIVAIIAKEIIRLCQS